MHSQVSRQIDSRTDSQVYSQVDRQIISQADRQIDRQIYCQINNEFDDVLKETAYDCDINSKGNIFLICFCVCVPFLFFFASDSRRMAAVASLTQPC